MTKDDLNNLGITQWELISEKYENPDLLLGNGFSMNINQRFNYRSLFEKFVEEADPKFKNLFQQFDTTNFELILEYLTYTTKVNSIFGLETGIIYEAIEKLKNGLITVINQVHPRASEIDKLQLDRLANQFIDNFGDIFTTNYDMFLYLIIMRSVELYNAGLKKFAYQDYFWGPLDSESKEFMPYQKLQHYRHIYYLHGALFLFNEGVLDYKILKQSSSVELIELIEDKIRNNKFPLFISEGTSEDKVKSINRSNYLDFCLEKLSRSERSVIIFGTSLASNDVHIVEALKNKKRDIVYAIYIGNRSEAELNSEKYRIAALFDKNSKTLEFVDSSSVFQL